MYKKIDTQFPFKGDFKLPAIGDRVSLSEASFEKRDSYLLVINDLLDQLGLSRIGYLPNIPEGVKLNALNSAYVVLLDDELVNFKAFIPPLVLATGGKLSIMHHRGEQVQQVARELAQLNPDIVLIDRGLADGISGVEVTKTLHELSPHSQLIGFSLAEGKHLASAYQAAGGLGAVTKRPESPWTSLHQIHELLSL